MSECVCWEGKLTEENGIHQTLGIGGILPREPGILCISVLAKLGAPSARAYKLQGGLRGTGPSQAQQSVE